MSGRTIKPGEIRGLRPKEIRARFGIAQSTLHFFCTALPEGERLPSLLLPSRGRTRKKGVRIIYEHELLPWLEKHRHPVPACSPAGICPQFSPVIRGEIAAKQPAG